MKVNMTPNPLDVVTIHASQGDTEARQWGFELHNNGELIDTSDVKEQLVFKAYKGGTEQILPENTSTPTTSPFKGDIKYPQGLLTDQEFTYRQSPTEEDGLAKITDIKGNTLVWNQLIQKGNMTDGWTFSNSTGSYSNNVLTFTASAQGGFVRPNNPQSIVANHKYLTMVDVKATSAFTSTINFTSRNLISINITTNWQTFSLVFTNTITEQNYFPRIYDYRQSGWDAIQIRNCMLIDLTQMVLDITDPSEFTSLFPLSYYAYNQGSLLSFNGNGIKTTGKNLFNSADVITGKYVNDANGIFREQSNSVATNYIEILPNTQYKIISAQPVGMWGSWYDTNKTFISGFANYATVKTSPSNAKYMAFTISYDGNNQDYANNVMLLLNGKNETFEPYTSSTLSLPISTYFPTGMKSAGDVYDELTESKAITRIGMVDLGTLEWSYDSSVPRFVSASISSLAKLPVNANTKANLTAVYKTESFSLAYTGTVDKCIALSTGGAITLVDKSYTDAQTFKTAMSGVYLYYELATPTETSFTTASLVTENAEIPLSNEDGTLIGKCTEQLSENPGFFDAKIKLADADGECYSNKIQLHVERSPQ